MDEEKEEEVKGEREGGSVVVMLGTPTPSILVPPLPSPTLSSEEASSLRSVVALS